ncbi:MAG: hypothetical protein HOH74_08945, partial [Gemmatimonadetes bacterium]|nr:hypothetical protein [Gemmatimonadota bacterium]
LPADSRWSPLLLTVITVAPLAAAFGNLPAPANETGYRAAGRWVREQTVPGDVIIAPYIVDSAIGYYSRGATVQRLRDAVRVGPRRLFVMTRPGTARFEFGDLMLTSNFTTDAANHLDAHRSWVLPAEAFETIAHFGRSTVSRPRKKLQRIDLGELTATGGWQLYAQTSEDAPQWGERRLADGRLSLQLRLQVGAAAVLHSVQTFTPAQDGLVLLGYAQQGTAYVSLLQMMQQQPQAMQMAKVVSASASVGDRGDGSEWFHELYMCPVRAGVRYGLYVTAADGGTADVANCTISFVPL